MFLSIINSIINSTLFWITSAVLSACYCGWYAKKHEDSWGEWFVLGAFTHSSFLFQQLFSAQSQSKSRTTTDRWVFGKVCFDLRRHQPPPTVV